jgi:hypothetical protein
MELVMASVTTPRSRLISIGIISGGLISLTAGCASSTPPTARVQPGDPYMTEAEFIQLADRPLDRWLVLDGSGSHLNRHDAYTVPRPSYGLFSGLYGFPFSVILAPLVLISEVVTLPATIKRSEDSRLYSQIYVWVCSVDGHDLVIAQSERTTSAKGAAKQSVADPAQLFWQDARTGERVYITAPLRRVPSAE